MDIIIKSSSITDAKKLFILNEQFNGKDLTSLDALHESIHSNTMEIFF
jgi:hypothetical protein